MQYHKSLFSKNGLSTMALARLFLGMKEGDKIPTVTDLNEHVGLARGTIQNSIKLLQKNDAIRLEARGHLGTFLLRKNIPILLEFSGITSIVGVMPLPYSRRYEGFATGILVALENQYNVPASMAYMRGAQNRISLLLSNRYDFAIISRYAAEEMQTQGDRIRIVKSFGEHSYLSKHIIVFHDKDVHEIQDGMRIGIDYESIDQKNLTLRICKDKQVDFVKMGYNQILANIIAGDIDAAIWNEDEITDHLLDMNYKTVGSKSTSDTEAVLVVDARKNEMARLLEEIIDVETVMKNQQLVMEGKITPSY